MMKSIEVVAAVIFDEQRRIFATQRGYGEWKDWWEFPGGKMEAGETALLTKALGIGLEVLKERGEID